MSKPKGNCYSHVDTIRVNAEFTRHSYNVVHHYRDRRRKRFYHSEQGKDRLAQRYTETATCFVCNKTALYRDHVGNKNYGACAEHRNMLPNKYKAKGSSA